MRQDKKTIERGVRMVKIKQIIEGKIASLDEVGMGFYTVEKIVYLYVM